jgi:hypothetical protein
MKEVVTLYAQPYDPTERRYKCHACGATFSETQGTPLYDLKYPHWVVVLILTLLAHGCPVPAVVAAFGTDERTVTAWLAHAGQHGERLQAQVVCNGQVEVGQVQADELYVKTQQGRVWMATAMSVFSRLFLWGEVAPHRTKGLLERVMLQVRAAAGLTEHVWSVRELLLFRLSPGNSTLS